MDFQEHKALVQKFHEKHSFAVGLDLEKTEFDAKESAILDNVVSTLFKAALRLEHCVKETNNSVAVARAQLMIEELAETIEALITRNKVDLLDGLSDLLFVTLGTAIAYDMPIEEGHREVCRSNLTKAVRKPEDDPRLRDKGPDYDPPRIKEILYGCAVCKYHSTENKAICNECESKGKTNE